MSSRRRLFNPRFWPMAFRYLWFRIRQPHVVVRGMVYMARGVEIRCTRGLGRLEIGRDVSIGMGTAIRCHEGLMRIGDRVVFGGRDTVNGYLHLEIGDDCLLADEVYVIDFDHRFDDPEIPIQGQGIVKAPIRIGRDCWIGTKSIVLRGTTLGVGSVVGAAAVVRGEFPDRSVLVGSPARLARRRPG